MNLVERLDRNAALFRDAPAVGDGEHWYTYDDLRRESVRLSASLMPVMHGLLAPPEGPHPPRVAIFAANSLFAIAALFAAMRAGLVAVPLPVDLRGERLARLLAHCGASAIFVSSALLPHLESVLTRCADLRLVIGDTPSTTLRGTASPVVAINADELALIAYTSGTTGRPRGVMLGHAALAWNAEAVVGYLRLRRTDRVLLVLPLSYIFGLSIVLTHVVAGASIVLERHFLYPNLALETLHRSACTGFGGVPATYELLLAHSTVRTSRFAALRYLMQAGGPLARGTADAIAAAFPGAALFIMYGATEAGPRIAFRIHDGIEERPGCVGRPVEGVVIRIVDEAGAELPPGSAGEVVVASPGLMLGYWRDDELTASVLREGWYRTGDIGLVDEEGSLMITGRIRDFIKVRGYRVHVTEIERALESLDGIEQAAVVGVPDTMLGEAPVAYLVGTRSDPVSIEREVAAVLPPQMRPVAYRVVSRLPTTSSGKVDRGRLRSEHSQLEGRST